MYILLDHTAGGDPVGAEGDMRSHGSLSVVFKIPKCTSHLGIGLGSTDLPRSKPLPFSDDSKPKSRYKVLGLVVGLANEGVAAGDCN